MSDDSSSSVDSNIPSCNGKVVQPNTSSPQKLNSVVISNSKDITIGDKYYYHGPVTIVQNHISHNPVHQFDMPKIDDQPTADLRIVSRNEWSAREPQRPLFLLELPPVNVIIAHTAGPFISTKQIGCEIVRNIQEYHTQVKRWDDIGYNFLVCGDGSIFVGRGWKYIGAHSRSFNQKAICIGFMGNFCEVEPSPQSLDAAQRLIATGVQAGKLDQHYRYRLYGHRQVSDTISPGDSLYRIIQTWDHWTDRAILP